MEHLFYALELTLTSVLVLTLGAEKNKPKITFPVGTPRSRTFSSLVGGDVKIEREILPIGKGGEICESDGSEFGGV